MLVVNGQQPPRIRIELTADEWRGERRWISPARLEVLWDDRHDYIELDRKLRTVAAWSPSRLERRSAESVFVALVPLELAEFNADSGGTSVIYDVPGLALLVGVSQEELRAEPAFMHEQELTVPWPTTERIAQAVAARYPHKLLSRIEREERDANEDALYGVTLTDEHGENHELSPSDVRTRFEDRQKPYLDKLREWIGVDRAVNLLERRDLLARFETVAAIATEALDALEPSQKRLVWKLRAQLAAAMDAVDALPPSG